MPKVLAQDKTIQAVGARWLVLGHGEAFVTANIGLEQVCTRLKGWYRSNGKFGLCSAKVLGSGCAQVRSCCSIGNCSTCAVKVESGVSAAIWWDKTRQMQHFPHFPTTDLV